MVARQSETKRLFSPKKRHSQPITKKLAHGILYLLPRYSAHYPRIIAIVFAKSDIPRPGWRAGVITNAKPQTGWPDWPDCRKDPRNTLKRALTSTLAQRGVPGNEITGGHFRLLLPL